MKTEKLSLKSIKNVLSRAEMKTIMAGSGCGGGCGCANSYCDGDAPCCYGFWCDAIEGAGGGYGDGGTCNPN